MPAKNYLKSEEKNKLQKALREEVNAEIREVANRSFKTIEELEYLLHRLLNEGVLIIRWQRSLKNKGNSVNVI
jgi:hypothetical protein